MTDIIFVGQFIASKAGKTGLTVTVDVDRYTISDGSRTALVTAGSATEGRRGLYSYRLASADLATYQYVATFITSDATVDQQEIAALGLVVPDALTSSRLAPATAGRALEVAATGEASANVTYLKGSVAPDAWVTDGDFDAAMSLLATASSIAALNDVSTSDLLAQALAALSSYDPPTKTEMDDALRASFIFIPDSEGMTYEDLVEALAGADGDTLETLSDQLDAIDTNVDDILVDTSTTLDDKLDAMGLIVNNIDVSDVTYVAQSNSGYLTITIGLTYNKYVTGLVIPVDWEKAYFTVKNDLEDEESESLIQLVVSNPADSETDGVRYLNGVLWHETVEDDPETDDDESDPEPYDKDLGALTVTQAAGRIDIYLTDELTVQLSTAKRIGWDVKFIDASGDSSGWRGIMDMVKTETQTV